MIRSNLGAAGDPLTDYLHVIGYTNHAGRLPVFRGRATELPGFDESQPGRLRYPVAECRLYPYNVCKSDNCEQPLDIYLHML